MKRLIIFLFGAYLFLYGCNDLYNITEEYFPIENTHYYIETNNNDSLLLIMEKDKYVIDNITVSGLWIEDSLIYLYSDETGIYTYIEKDSTFLLWIPMPLIDGFSYEVKSDNYNRTGIVTKENDTYYIDINENNTNYRITLEKDKGITQWIYQ